MKIGRRRLLAGGTALAVVGPCGLGAAEDEPLVAAAHQIQLAPESYPPTPMWAYGGTVPGPTFRLTQGATFRTRFQNDLPEASAIHWHGLRAPADFDVPPAAPGGAREYAFDLPDAGTNWYGPNANPVAQLARGLAGAVIVEEANPPEVDGDELLVLSDWRLVDPADISEDFDNEHDTSHAGRIGNFVTVNGAAEARFESARNARWRLRVVNTAPARIFELELKGLDGWVAAIDGMPVDAPFKAPQIFLAPGQRVDLIVDVTEDVGAEAYLLEIYQGEGFALATFLVGEGGARRDAPAALPPNPGAPAPEIAEARILPMRLSGGALRGLADAKRGGEAASEEELAEAGLYWAMDGSAGRPPEPFAILSEGETLRVPLLNQTAFPQALHLHGHHFREVYGDGSLGHARDVQLVDPGTVREIALQGTRKGDWLFRSTVPHHWVGGMENWIRVE